MRRLDSACQGQDRRKLVSHGLNDIRNAGSILENQNPILTMCIWDALNANASRTKLLLRNEFCLEQLNKCLGVRNLTQQQSRGHTMWKDMLESASKGIWNLQTKKKSQVYTVSTPRLDEQNFKEEKLEALGEVSDVCTENFLKCLI